MITMRNMHIIQERQRYSIRKYSFGAASVLIGASLLMAGPALADEVVTSQVTPTAQPALLAETAQVQIPLAGSEVAQLAGVEVVSLATSEVTSTAVPSLVLSEVASSESDQALNLQLASQSASAEISVESTSPASLSEGFESTSLKTSTMATSEVSYSDQSQSQSASQSQSIQEDSVSHQTGTSAFRRMPVAEDRSRVDDGSLELPAQGTFVFRRLTEIKTQPSASLKPTFIFSKGDHVIYDQVLKNDGHQWISYLGYDYKRYYADIATLRSTVENPVVRREETASDNLAESGRYTFTQPADVKNQPSLTAKTEFTLDPGMAVNYDKTLTADNHRWISYVSYSGTRRYVDLGVLATEAVKPTGDISIQKQANGDFSVLITNVSDANGILGVSVPIWSDKNNQDDIIWYNASKLQNGNYKVNVSLSDHKNDRGLYHVHLYYVESNGKLVGVTGTTTTVAAQEDKPSGKATVSNVTSQGFDVTISDIKSPKDIQEVLVPVWSVKDGQDDLVWHVASPQVDGSAKVHIKLSDHKGDSGDYLVHFYYLIDGKRVGIGGTQVSVPKALAENTRHNLPASGRYTFDGRASIKAEPRMAASELAYYDKGMSVNYDKVLDADGYTWISYLSYSGNRRYVALAPLTQAEVKPSGKLVIENVTTQGCDVRVTDVVAGNKTIQEVVVPVWSVRDNQDDLQWLSAQRQADGTYKTHVRVLEHKNDSGDYIVHLYYKIDGQLVGIGGTTTTVPAPVAVAPANHLPASGRYTFGERASIKAEARLSAPELAYYDKGMSVNYDKVLTADGYTWLSYLSYQGNRRYVAIAKATVEEPKPQVPSGALPASGRYTFGERSSIKSEPRQAAEEVAYFDKGMSVNYDKLVEADGRTWLSYISYAGSRYYVALAPENKASASASNQANQPSLPSSGRYAFTQRASIKASPTLASPELAYYDKGMSVNYDKVLTFDDHTWLSYLSYSGARRYVMVG